MASIKDIMARYQNNSLVDVATKSAGAQEPVANDTQADPVKIAHEAGVRDAENLMKVANVLGDVIGERVVAKIAESFGHNPEVSKTASLQDMLLDTVVKIAEQVTGNTAVGGASAVHAETLQIAESAAHHANLAVQSASDAVQSLHQGDEHTAAQQFATAANAIEQAQRFAARVQVPEVHQHVAECANIVNSAAGAAGGAPQA